VETVSTEPQASECSLIAHVLEFVGENPEREGLKETPKRYLKFLKEVTSCPEFNLTTFENEGGEDMIVQTDIPFYSLCEHHMVPFFGTACVAYLPKKRIVGLSKLARIVEKYSRKLQNQERITFQIAEELSETLDCGGVAVVMKARHLCMEMRGVRKAGATTTTSRMVGAFLDDPSAKSEVLKLFHG
jgi:GTP cyclohydrolase I|tara:strand:+ start:1898 stop:2458 length:561 start_codon:yes stop_codon:yes gene_type:complete